MGNALGGWGLVIAIIALVLIVILYFLYFWQKGEPGSFGSAWKISNIDADATIKPQSETVYQINPAADKTINIKLEGAGGGFNFDIKNIGAGTVDMSAADSTNAPLESGFPASIAAGKSIDAYIDGTSSKTVFRVLAQEI